jgi:hypothetical protein
MKTRYEYIVSGTADGEEFMVTFNGYFEAKQYHDKMRKEHPYGSWINLYEVKITRETRRIKEEDNVS